jgi:SagB-type dehydrogenase family enzyme
MTRSVPRCAQRMRLRPDVFVATAADGQVALLQGTSWGENLGLLTDAEKAVLRELGLRERPEPELSAMLGHDNNLLRRLHAGGWLTVTYGHSSRPLVTIRPLGPHREPRPAPLVAPRLSRFAVLHRVGDALLLESPLARASVVVHDTDVVAVIHYLAGPGKRPLAVRLPPSIVAEVVAEMAWYGFVHEAEEDVRPDLATEQWSPHELWFHSRSRAGHHDLPFGATLWAKNRHPPLPARRPPWSATALPLPEPRTPLTITLSAALDARQSIRHPDSDAPLTLTQLGEFLHRVARVRHVAEDGGHEVTLRPSPSGGALHSLEIYPVTAGIPDLAAGMYHYDPFDHLLEPVPAGQFACRQLVNRAAAAAGGAPPPQVLLVIAARFGRAMWKYQSMAYALILKDLGALVQTMYLVATAMNLAPCALGSGDITLFANATNLNPLEESSVGEFILSSRARPTPMADTS